MKNTPSGLFALLLAATAFSAPSAAGATSLKKITDLVIYRDARFHSGFPSVVRKPDGELLVAFRRAPDRRLLGDASYSHVDPNSNLMLVRSTDDGRTWTREPQLLYAHPFGGSQDPGLVQLRDGSLLCSSYVWAWMPPEALAKLKQPMTVNGGQFVQLGGYILRSRDGGNSWDPPIIPPPCEGQTTLNIFGQPLPAHNRGAICEGADGRLFWAVAISVGNPARSEVHLMISEDKGATWKYSCPIAQDATVKFNQTSLYETPNGDLVAFINTMGLNDHLAVARSTDQGKSFQKWQDAGVKGRPFHAVRLPDGQALLVYGYRYPPYGVRVRVLNADCTAIADSAEVVLRDDGGSNDLGFPWATMLSKTRALVVYQFNKADGPRAIEGSVVEIGPRP